MPLAIDIDIAIDIITLAADISQMIIAITLAMIIIDITPLH
jgi:hypothetical protein